MIERRRGRPKSSDQRVAQHISLKADLLAELEAQYGDWQGKLPRGFFSSLLEVLLREHLDNVICRKSNTTDQPSSP